MIVSAFIFDRLVSNSSWIPSEKKAAFSSFALRFLNGMTAMDFCLGCGVPSVSPVSLASVEVPDSYFSFQPFRGHFEGPGENHGDGKTKHENKIHTGLKPLG